MLIILLKSHLIRHSGMRRAFKDTQRALEHLRNSDSTRALREHSEGTRALGHSEGTWALGHLRHFDTRTLRALEHLGSRALKALGHLRHFI